MLIVVLLDLGVGDLNGRLEVGPLKPDDGQRHLLVQLFVLLLEHRFRERGTAVDQLAHSGIAQIVCHDFIEISGCKSVRLQSRIDKNLVLCWIKLIVRLELRQCFLGIPDLVRCWYDLEAFGLIAKQKQVPGVTQ